MAQVILTDCYVSLDGTDYSGQGTNVAISYSAEAIDNTPFGASTRKHSGGTKDWAVELEFIQDETVSGQAFFDMVGTVVNFEARPTSAVASAENPAYSGDVLVTNYTPLGGAYGELSRVSLSLVSAGDLSRVVV